MTGIIQEIRSWLIVSHILFQYVLYRLGLRGCPTFMDHRPECKQVIGRVLGWPGRLRAAGVEFCPKDHPAVFCCNHFKKDDPFVVEANIYEASDRHIWVIPMMRDDFFKSHHKFFLFDPDELINMFGTLRISRESVTLSQLKPFVELLRSRGSFLMFPGRTRSQSGLLFEYREGIEEPGGPTFFAAQAQRNHPELKVAIVPVARSYNPATKKTTVSYGQPLYLEGKSDRAAQRALDFRVIEEIGNVLELNASNVLAGYLYLHRLHRCGVPIRMEKIEQDLQSVFSNVGKTRRIDPDAARDLPKEIRRSLRYFERMGMLRHTRDSVCPNDEAILSVPELGPLYRKKNPVKFLANQIAHMADVVRALEDVVLE